MLEAAAGQSPRRLRNLFVILLITCGLSNPGQLWESHKESLTEDILMRARIRNPGMDLIYTSNMFNQALVFLEDKVRYMAGKDLKQLGLPTPERNRSGRLSRELRTMPYWIW